MVRLVSDPGYGQAVFDVSTNSSTSVSLLTGPPSYRSLGLLGCFVSLPGKQ